MQGSTDATDESKVAGIVEQVRADMQLRGSEDSERLLKQRLDEAGIQLPQEEVSRLVHEVQNGPSVVD
ncbi:hypothetical protein SAMN04515691_2916 [Leifsonia sp. 98AMF]|nr:hypothetical protein AXZ95_1088 [Leifsonia sp. 115AMFTsu3.1]SDH17661.1 hypothetical protein SAMN04515690_1100 [Leifsonia sp. 197AMF]SDJ20754.1 hypothetical protein SAMN04515684_2682 [Leifsonia sp. 466MF]SDJ44616.1 hypothetical protein SAMN04515683_0061 [Leifsonia sp. 157MF]SDN42328.1 hypothetical protein SAMN04515686_0866 [Leifsonia sp. 509MF]SEM78113.1 hypothetical protein SAMN04515685_0049 [Leifsonia sp. 467MF]SFM54872.1 hypothetical protein SAMN04515691_2916 [Leifsonia sp. 98AMF]